METVILAHEFVLCIFHVGFMFFCLVFAMPLCASVYICLVAGRICNNFEKNRAFYDKSMKLGTWLVDNKTKIIRVSATPKMPSNGHHLVFPKWPTYSL